MTSESPQPNQPITVEDIAPEESSSTPVLNRAERRAQAKGKKALPTQSNQSGFQGGNFGGGSNRALPVQNKSRIPRTGHK